MKPIFCAWKSLCKGTYFSGVFKGHLPLTSTPGNISYPESERKRQVLDTCLEILGKISSIFLVIQPVTCKDLLTFQSFS